MKHGTTILALFFRGISKQKKTLDGPNKRSFSAPIKLFFSVHLFGTRFKQFILTKSGKNKTCTIQNSVA
jgi:hypothetical protein